MTKMLEKALDAVRRLDPVAQDEIARTLMALVGADELPPVVMTDSERTAIAASKAASARGEFATEEQVQSVWAKHGP